MIYVRALLLAPLILASINHAQVMGQGDNPHVHHMSQPMIPADLSESLPSSPTEFLETLLEAIDSDPMDLPPINLQPTDSQPMNSQPTDSQPMNSQPQPMDSQPQPMDSQPTDSQPMDSQPMNSQPTDSPLMDTPPVQEPQPVEPQVTGQPAESNESSPVQTQAMDPAPPLQPSQPATPVPQPADPQPTEPQPTSTPPTPAPTQPTPPPAPTQAPVISAPATDYCNISPDQTLCLFKGPSASCGQILISDLTEDDRDLLVSEHNRLRALVANGKVSNGFPGPQPSAANMLEVTWDSELASEAQMWAQQCSFGHDEVRRLPRFEVGQNVFMTSASVDQPMDEALIKAVSNWFNEVNDFNNTDVGDYQFHSTTGHYTQLVWATTNLVGCGQITYTTDFVNKYVVCNYGPAGNLLDAPMYLSGPPCSQCPDQAACSTLNPGLCALSQGPASNPGQGENLSTNEV